MTHTKKKEKKLKIEEWKLVKVSLATAFFDKEGILERFNTKKWEIYNCAFGENIGHEQSDERPVLIISGNFFNKNSTIVTVAPLSTKFSTKVVTVKGRKKEVLKYKCQYLLEKRFFPFLNDDSVIKFDQIKTVSKCRLGAKIGEIAHEDTQNRLNKKLCEFLDI